MKQEIQLFKELEKLKSDPHYIDLFCRNVSEQAGENHEFITSILDEAIAFCHKEEYPQNYIKLMGMTLKEKLTLGGYNEVVQLGKGVLQDLKEDDKKTNRFEIYQALLIAYTEMSLFEEAHFYKDKLVDVIDEESPTNKYIDSMLSIIRLYVKSEVYEEAKALLIHLEKLKDWITPRQEFNKNLLYLEILLRENQIDEATQRANVLYHAVSPFEKERSHLYELGEVLRLRGILNQKRNLYVQAEKDFKLANGYSRGYKGLYVKCLIDFANFFIENEQYEEAKDKIHLAIEIAEQNQMKDIISKGSRALSKIDEMNAHWKKAYEHLKKSKEQAVKPCEIKSMTPIRSTKSYEKNGAFLNKIVQLGQAFNQSFSLENLQEMVSRILSSLIEMDLVGIAVVQKGKMQYKVYDVCEEWLNHENALVKYTSCLLEHCIQFQTNVTIQDGNFEEYTLKTIENTATGKKLNSVIVRLLKAENQVIGAMFIGSYQTEKYTPKDIEIAEIIASYIGLNLKNTYLYDKISYLEEHDLLTGLLSRPVVMRNGEKLFKENYKKHKKTAIMRLDIDQFKLVNTKYGYALGDQILSRMGEIISKSARDEDYVGRYGSKAFIIILDNPTEQEVVDIAGKIKKSLAENTFETKKDKNITVTLSGGIYLCNEYTLNFDEAIHYANDALYRAKLLGRNRMINYNITEGKR